MPSKTKPAYHHGDLRRELLTHAARMLDSHGEEQLSLRDLAKQARVSPAAPYRHFESKDALLVALAEEGFAELENKLLKAMAKGPSDARAQLFALARAYVDLAAQRPNLFRMMFSADLGPSEVERGIFRACDRVYIALVNTLASAQKTGWLTGGDPERQALGFWSLLHGFAMLHVDHRLDDLRLDDEARTALLNELLEGLFAGLERRAP